MNKLGCFIQQLTPAVLDWIGLARPPVVLWCDPNQNGVDEIRRRSPGTFIIGRKYEAGQNWQALVMKQVARRFVLWAAGRAGALAWKFSQSGSRRKQALAYFIARSRAEIYGKGWNLWQAAVGPESWADRCAAMARCDAWICWNEAFGHDNKHLFAQFDEWQIRFRQRMLQHGAEAIAFNFGTGNFTAAPDRVKVSDAFPRTCQQFEYFGVHEYFWPTMRKGQIWHTVRFPAWHDDIGRNDAIFIITECGVTQAIIPGRPDRGWRDNVPDAPTEAEHLADWSWYNRELCARAYVKGAMMFTFGGYGWETFEYSNHGIRFQIAALDAPGPQPPPNGGGKMEVYDREGNLLSEAAGVALMAKYGLAIWPPSGLKPGDEYFVVTRLWEKTGGSAFVYSVRDAAGDPVHNPDAGLDLALPHRAFWWRNMGDANDVKVPYPTDREAEADIGGLENGHGGSGMGPGAYTGYNEPPEKGPHRAWVRHPTVPSDELVGVRMIAGTPHDHLDAEWQASVWEGASPVPPQEKPVARLREIAAEITAIADELSGVGLIGLVLKFEDGTQREIAL